VSEEGVNPEENGGTDVQLWEPRRVLRRIEPAEAALSRGFLRSHPEKWFPGFGAHWLPIMHALGCEARISEVKPSMHRPVAGESVFVGTVDGEPLILSVDPESTRHITEEVVPGARGKAADAVLEYLLRRLLASLALSWSGPESSTVTFGGPADPSVVQVATSVKISLVINTVTSSVRVGLGMRMAERLDRLWRRQVHSSARVPQGDAAMRLEIAQLGVPPQMLSDYLTKGTVIDLEVRASDTLIVRYGTKPWMPARMVEVGGKFGCEIVSGVLSAPAVPEGTTRLSVELTSVNLDSTQIAELSQPGAILVTDIPLGEMVNLVINGDKVGEARLCVYEGRFAIEVQ
jgi:hypothetical protein